MFVLDVEPFLHLVGGKAGPVAEWAADPAVRNLTFVSTVTIGIARAMIERQPPGKRRTWEDRMRIALREFSPRLLAFSRDDAELWAELHDMELTVEGEDGAGLVDLSVLMPAAQAMLQRFQLVDRTRPYIAALRENRGLLHLDPYGR